MVVDRVARTWLGKVGGILAVIGVIAAPITSGDTALRSARLIVADFMHLDQKPILKRLMISIPLFCVVFGFSFINFDIVWRYFSWTNQTLAMVTLWAGAVFLCKQEIDDKEKRYPLGYLMALVPAVFMTMVSMSYIMIAPEGINLSAEHRWIGYVFAGVVSVVFIALFARWQYLYANSTKRAHRD